MRLAFRRGDLRSPRRLDRTQGDARQHHYRDGLGTFLIGMLPTYQEIGVAAPNMIRGSAFRRILIYRSDLNTSEGT
jgi:hypothetical protein